jgi:Bacterial regulatory helix-turn-helix protein, lysR family
MTGEHLDWDNLRYFLAVARAGKLTAAARRLGTGSYDCWAPYRQP